MKGAMPSPLVARGHRRVHVGPSGLDGVLCCGGCGRGCGARLALGVAALSWAASATDCGTEEMLTGMFQMLAVRSCPMPALLRSSQNL